MGDASDRLRAVFRVGLQDPALARRLGALVDLFEEALADATRLGQMDVAASVSRMLEAHAEGLRACVEDLASNPADPSRVASNVARLHAAVDALDQLVADIQERAAEGWPQEAIDADDGEPLSPLDELRASAAAHLDNLQP